MEVNNGLVEIAVGSVSNRGNVIPISEIKNLIRPETELYRSMFVLDESAQECFDTKGTIISYKGTYAIDKITFDIDKGAKTEEQVVDLVKYFIENLADMHVEKSWIRPWFSGRGFHVDIPNLFGLQPSKELPQVLAKTIKKMFNGLVDNIYDKGRIIRVGYSYNSKTGLYKTPLKLDEIFNLSYKQIADISKTFSRKDFRPEPLPKCEAIWTEHVVTMEKPKQISVTRNINETGLNAHVTCVQKMYNKGEEKGTRHKTILRMISAWKRMGIPQAGSEKMAEIWGATLTSEETTRLVNDVYKWNHNGYGCADDVMEKFCDSQCKFFRNKDYGLEVMSAMELSQELKEFLIKDYAESSFNLQNLYNIPSPYMIYAGELVTMIGDTKVGKTAFIQNICAKLTTMKTLFMSLEVHSHLMYRRFIQIAMNKTKDEVNDIFKNGTDADIKQAEKSVEHIHIMTTSPEIKNIRQLVSDHQPKILVIDTIDAVRVDYMSDPLAKTQSVVNALKDIAQNQNVIIIAISHISKSASYNGVLDRHSAKGDSALEQKSDKLIGISQFDVASKARVIESIVARDENNFKLRCWFNHETFRFVDNG
jgi:archaellum biogenesis ATPase FlaH